MLEKEIKALVSLIGDDDEEVHQHVVDKLISLGGTVIPFLEREWEQSMEPLAQRRIEELIHSLQFEQLKKDLRKWKEDESENLLKGMWLVSLYSYPDTKYEDIAIQVDQIYYEAYVSLGKDNLHPLDQIRMLNHIFFDRLGFSANTKNFHSPANSMIKEVLETRKGNPISLSVIYMLVAQRLKLPVFGVNLPNLFVLTYKNFSSQFYINAFNKGIIFMRKDIDSYIEKLNLERMDAFYEPCNHLDIVMRVLRNLIMSFNKLGEHDKEQEIKELLAVLEE